VDGNRCMPHSLISLLEHVELSRSGWRERAVDQLVLGLLWISSAPMEPGEIPSRLNDAVGFSLSLAVLLPRVEQLVGEQVIIRLADGRIRLSQVAERRFDQRSSDAEALDRLAKQQFEASLQRHCPELDAWS